MHPSWVQFKKSEKLPRFEVISKGRKPQVKADDVQSQLSAVGFVLGLLG